MKWKRRALTIIRLTSPITGTILGKIYVVILQCFFDRIVYVTYDMVLIIIGFTIFSIATVGLSYAPKNDSKGD